MQMTLAGSLIGACSRADAAGIVTASLIDATASALAAPPSRNSRVDAGTSAAASCCARITPRAVSVAATLAVRSTMRSPWRAPRRGVWPLEEKRTSFMDGCLPSERYRDYSPFGQARRSHRIPCVRPTVGGTIGRPDSWGAAQTGRSVYAQDIRREVPDVADHRVVGIRGAPRAARAGPTTRPVNRCDADAVRVPHRRDAAGAHAARRNEATCPDASGGG